MIPIYWYDNYNFGDQLTPYLLSHYEIPFEWSPFESSRAMGVGSIAQLLPDGYEGTLWGTGYIFDIPHPLPHANFLGVRGPLSRFLLSAPTNTPLGDPGLLVPKFVPRQETKWALGIVPHQIHQEHPLIKQLAQQDESNITVIDPRREVDTVVRHISSCSAIISTSLHGIITADAFNIPSLWASLDDDPLTGGIFKFLDHDSFTNASRRVDLNSDTAYTSLVACATAANQDFIATACSSLEKSVQELKDL